MGPLKPNLSKSERHAILGTGTLAMLLLLAAGVQAAEPQAAGPLSLRVTPATPWIGDPVLLEGFVDGPHRVRVRYYRVLR